MRASDAREVEILALIHNYLLSGPWHRALPHSSAM